jgi:hypothetical protein
MKELVELKEIIESQSGLIKYSTNIPNLYVYGVQLGWGYSRSIIEMQNREGDYFYGEKSIILVYKEYINGKLCGGIRDIVYTRGIKSKYTIKEKLCGKKISSSVAPTIDATYYTVELFYKGWRID